MYLQKIPSKKTLDRDPTKNRPVETRLENVSYLTKTCLKVHFNDYLKGLKHTDTKMVGP